MRKLLDGRVNSLIKRVCDDGHRGLFVIIGDNAKDQVMTLHHLLSRSKNTPCSDILWCYKKSLDLSSNANKRRRQMRKKAKGNKTEAVEGNAFDRFVSSNNITFALYKDSHRVLGCTFSMCVLQDFEAVTPNLLAQTVETVAGGGLVVILLQKMSSLRQLSSIASDFYARLRKDNSDRYDNEIICRFNERFTLSLINCQNCVFLDDELNVLPLSSQTVDEKKTKKIKKKTEANANELSFLKTEMKESKPLCHLLNLCKTLDQAKTLLSFIDVSLDKKNAVVSVTAARGRGKTFVCGLFIAYSVAVAKLTNIYVTSPYPQNLRPLFDALKKGLEAVGYKERTDFEEVRSTNSSFAKAVVRLNIFREHSQFVQYIEPSNHSVISKSQAQLMIIDEAAAIPLPTTKQFLAPACLSVLSSTTSGYEGTGRSLTLKLLKSLRELSASGGSQKLLRETSLAEPVRYSPGDAIEAWLGSLLCLEAPLKEQKFLGNAPHPSKCQLYLVNRDALFSGHKTSEAFLARVMSLVVASHYRNSPNDLQLLADAPEHRVFALTSNVEGEVLPRVLCVLQVAFEGNLDRDAVQKGFTERIQAAGDLIPWTLSTQYQEKSFPSLFGVRVVRVAVHTDLQGMGYGSQALKLLTAQLSSNLASRPSNEKGSYKSSEKEGFSKKEGVKRSKDGEMKNGDKDQTDRIEKSGGKTHASYRGDGLLEEKVEPMRDIPPLLLPVSNISFGLDWIGVSFGLTQKLFNFWSRGGFKTVYLRQSSNKLTGEHSCIMLKRITEKAHANKSIEFFQKEFLPRYMSLLSYGFKKFSVSLALSLIHSSASAEEKGKSEDVRHIRIKTILSQNDRKRVKAYSQNLVDFTTIVDLLPKLAELFFGDDFPEVKMSFVQKAIFVAVGLQRRSIEELSEELDIATSQLLGLFNKTIRKFSNSFDKIG